MSDLGDLLKKAREQRNLSLDDIQDLTKIRKRYLEAIEEGNYSLLPGSFYVRAFVKNYAESVGLDAEEVLRLYNKEIPSSLPEQQAIEPVQRSRRTTQTQTSDRISRWGFRALMWSFLLLIIVLVYIFAIKQPSKVDVDSADQSKMTDQTEPPATSPDKDTVNNGTQTGSGTVTGNETDGGTGTNTTPPPADQPPVEETTPPPATTTLTLDRTSGSTDYYNVSPGGIHKIEFKSTGRVWVGVYQNSRNGKMVLSKTLDSGGTATYDSEGPVYISVAHANTVDVTVDGVAIDDGNKSGSRKMQLTPIESTTNNGGTTDGNGTGGTTGTTDTTTTQ